MKIMRLKSVLRKKYVITTESNHGFLISNNELNRAFSSLQLVEKWVSDITYIRVNDYWIYLIVRVELLDSRKHNNERKVYFKMK